MDKPEDVHTLLLEKINLGEKLIQQMETIKTLDGALKLQRKIKQELLFLQRLQDSKKIKIEQLSCSNLRHLGALVECALRPGVVSVCKTFHVHENKLLVDVIGDEGKTWTKVIARNPKSLSALSSGNASYGARSILDQAEDYLECAKLFPCMYQSPKVVFEFASGIEKNLANRLQSLGIVVKGEVLPDSKPSDDLDDTWNSSDEGEEDCHNGSPPCLQEINQCIEDNPDRSDIDTLNLDVTAMMAYVSNMTNGHCNYVFKQDVLTQQSAWEAERPVKPVLDKLFEGKTLVCCKTAWNDFEKIVNILGGPNEKKRAADLKERMNIFDDDFAGEDDYARQTLKVRGHVRLRSKIIFNFGNRIKALTVSANEGFVRAAMQQGVTYAAFIHESRALTEGKEASATEITL
ncbi:UPF0415 protein C7orf25 homolog [Epargyreus clarus]|uniref:UPF0415 protein C7orf25 homolog n=1 Tax=Epargyreus clarus TaxID=520877 RepID=UPI003C2AB3BD